MGVNQGQNLEKNYEHLSSSQVSDFLWSLQLLKEVYLVTKISTSNYYREDYIVNILQLGGGTTV